MVDSTLREVEQLLLKGSRQHHRGTSQNLVHKLWQRQVLINCPAQAYHKTRSIYHCIVPNHTEQGVQPPLGFLRKFSPDGRFLLAFSNDQRNILVYDYRGASAAQSLYLEDHSEEDIKTLLFDRFFKLRFSVPVAQNGEYLNRECSLFTEDCQYMIVVSSATIPEEQHPSMLDVLKNNESVFQSPLEDYTLYLVDILGGVVADSKTFKCDKISLSHNQGLSLCNSRLAILSIQQQTIHVFDISGGALIALQAIGRFCYHDDDILCSESSPHGPESGDESRYVHPFLEKWFTTLKQRFLCFLLKQAEERSSGTDRFPLANFFKKYTTLSALRVAKIQLLDKFHLLLKYSSEDVITLKQSDSSTHPSLYVVYNIETTDILSVHESTSKELLEIYESHVDSFRAPVSHPLCRNISSLSNNSHSRALHMKFKQTITSAKYGGSKEATRRLLGQLPVCSQSFSSSPYLDLSLFAYDDKWISPLERPKPCGDNPVKFFSRENGQFRFQLETALCAPLYTQTNRRLVAYIFQPSEPFVISIQKAVDDYVVGFHFRNCFRQ
jgi:de-etiolated-1